MDDKDAAPRKESPGKRPSGQGGARRNPSSRKKTPKREKSAEGTQPRKASPEGAGHNRAYDATHHSKAKPKTGTAQNPEGKPKPGSTNPSEGKPKPGSTNPSEGKPKPGSTNPSEGKPKSGSTQNSAHKKRRRKEAPDRAGVSADRDISGAKEREDGERIDFLEDRKDFKESNKEGSKGSSKEDKMEKRHRRKKKRKQDQDQNETRKIAMFTAGGILGALLLVYVGFAIYFNSHFMFFTTINGTSCSMMSVSQVEDSMKQQVADYTLTLKESGGRQESIAGTGISMEYVPGEQLAKLMEEQNGFAWPKSLWEHPKIEAEVGVKYDEAALAEKIAGLSCMNPETQTPSVDAHPEFQENQFAVVPEVVGTQINMEVFQAKVAEAVSGFQPTLDLSETKCYVQPRFVADSPEVTAAAAAMNAYLGANVTYDFNPHTEVVDSASISQWVKVDADMNVTFDEEAVRAYIQSLAEKYNTKGLARSFTTATGNVVTVEGGGYGWKIDQDAEFAALTANIQNAEVVTREPNYSSRGASHEGNDMGNTYAEVDLTGQKMYFIQNGQVVLQSDCVTGNPNNGNATPQGVYTMDWKQRNRTLRGERRPDGSYEYETPVAFWMPFNGGIGFHDATWQSAFGGNRYRTYGSHGCVNLPYSIAQQLFSLMYEGVPVVCHY